MKKQAEFSTDVTNAASALDTQKNALAMIEVERLLNEVLEREEALFEASPDATIIVSEKGVIERVNSSALHLFGYSSGEMLGSSLELLIPERFHRMHAVHTRAFQSNPVKRGMGTGREVLGRRKDGEEVSLSIALSPFYAGDGNEGKSFIATIRDLTQSEWHKRELYKRTYEFQESERRYRLMFQNNPIPMWVTDRESFTFLAVNDAALTLYGYTATEFLQLRALDIRPPEDVASWLEYIKRIKDSSAAHKRQSCHVTASGRRSYVTTTHFRIEWEGKNAELVMAWQSTDEFQGVGASV